MPVGCHVLSTALPHAKRGQPLSLKFIELLLTSSNDLVLEFMDVFLYISFGLISIDFQGLAQS
jgi:hypothetical protein